MKLKQAVAIRGLRTFVTHDAISKGVFSLGFSSGQGPAEAWAPILTNSDDNAVAPGIL